jgi:hypothetical protein
LPDHTKGWFRWWRIPAQALKKALRIEEVPDFNIDKTDGEEEKEAA